jgi:cytochrome c peroxidase
MSCKFAIFLFLGFLINLSLSARPEAEDADWRKDYRRPDAIEYPDDNPYSAVKAALGRALFFDPILSGSQDISCASCHNPALSWQDGLPRAIGASKTPSPKRTPTLLNVGSLTRLGWDGKFHDIESVAFTPITSPAMMNLPETTLLARLNAIPGYVDQFAKAFDDGQITRHNIELALATYERSIVSGEAPFDRWVMGDTEAISDAAKQGFEVFKNKGRCAECHSGWAFTDGSFHDIGTATGDNIGRGRLFPTSIKLRYAFKTPTLRDVYNRPPYMHDGSIATLEGVIDHYDRGGVDRPSRAEAIKPLHLTDVEKENLLAFLKTLTGAPPDFEVRTLVR